jgi:hypothetical protein
MASIGLLSCEREIHEPAEAEDTPAPLAEWEWLECISEVDTIDIGLGEPMDVWVSAIALPQGAQEPIEVTDRGWWTVLEGDGTVSDGVFTTSDERGGVAVVEVQLDGLAASCEIEVHLHLWIDGARTGLQAEDIRAQEVEANDECAAIIVYPSREASFPANQYPPDFQWLPGWWGGLYVVDIETEYVHALVTTRERSWEPDFSLLKLISRSHGGADVDVTVRVLSADFDYQNISFSTHLCAAVADTEIRVSRVLLRGSVVYWSPVNEGLWSIEIGSRESVPILDPDRVGGCVGCHALNPGVPERMSMSWDERSVVTEVRDLASPLTPPSDDRPSTFTVLDGSGENLIRAWEGTLFVDDVATGFTQGALPTVGYATHPTMSADGDRLVYSSCEPFQGLGWRMSGCDLRVIELDRFGELTVERELLMAPDGWNYYYPSISPNGQWVVFNRSTGDTNDDSDAELMLIPLILEGDPIRLDRANGGINLTNSWPRWGAMVGDRAWLSFSSRRAYGDRAPGLAPQIWLAELDLALAYSSFDPSRAAIRLPGQDLETGNHTPVWIPRGAGI